MIYNIPFYAVIIIIAIGLYTVAFKRNLVKIAMGITIIQSGVNLFLITLGYREDGLAPIFTHLPKDTTIPEGMVLPVPQALTLTSIVIGVSITALMLSMIVLIYRHTGNIDAEKSRKLKG